MEFNAVALQQKRRRLLQHPKPAGQQQKNQQRQLEEKIAQMPPGLFLVNVQPQNQLPQ